MDDTKLMELLEPDLTGADGWEVELLDLEDIQVAVAVQSDEDGEVSWGQRQVDAAELFVRHTRQGKLVGIFEDHWILWK